MAQGRRGVFAPSLVVSYSHSDDDIDRTVEAIDSALGVYRRALEDGPDWRVRRCGRYFRRPQRRSERVQLSSGREPMAESLLRQLLPYSR